MKRKTQKLLALSLAFAMTVGLAPINAAAADAQSVETQGSSIKPMVAPGIDIQDPTGEYFVNGKVPITIDFNVENREFDKTKVSWAVKPSEQNAIPLTEKLDYEVDETGKTYTFNIAQVISTGLLLNVEKITLAVSYDNTQYGEAPYDDTTTVTVKQPYVKISSVNASGNTFSVGDEIPFTKNNSTVTGTVYDGQYPSGQEMTNLTVVGIEAGDNSSNLNFKTTDDGWVVTPRYNKAASGDIKITVEYLTYTLTDTCTVEFVEINNDYMLEINADIAQVMPGSTIDVEAIVREKDSDDEAGKVVDLPSKAEIVWKSGDTAIATVQADGTDSTKCTVTGAGAQGNVTVTATMLINGVITTANANIKISNTIIDYYTIELDGMKLDADINETWTVTPILYNNKYDKTTKTYSKEEVKDVDFSWGGAAVTDVTNETDDSGFPVAEIKTADGAYVAADTYYPAQAFSFKRTALGDYTDTSTAIADARKITISARTRVNGIDTVVEIVGKEGKNTIATQTFEQIVLDDSDENTTYEIKVIGDKNVNVYNGESTKVLELDATKVPEGTELEWKVSAAGYYSTKDYRYASEEKGDFSVAEESNGNYLLTLNMDQLKKTLVLNSDVDEANKAENRDDYSNEFTVNATIKQIEVTYQNKAGGVYKEGSSYYTDRPHAVWDLTLVEASVEELPLGRYDGYQYITKLMPTETFTIPSKFENVKVYNAEQPYGFYSDVTVADVEVVSQYNAKVSSADSGWTVSYTGKEDKGVYLDGSVELKITCEKDGIQCEEVVAVISFNDEQYEIVFDDMDSVSPNLVEAQTLKNLKLEKRYLDNDDKTQTTYLYTGNVAWNWSGDDDLVKIATGSTGMVDLTRGEWFTEESKTPFKLERKKDSTAEFSLVLNASTDNGGGIDDSYTFNFKSVCNCGTDLPSNLKKHEATEPTCTTAGNKEYYECTVHSGNYYVLEDGKYVAASMEEIMEGLEATGHKLELVPAKEATATEAGNKAYYKCSVCGATFEDEEGKIPITADDYTIPATGQTTPAEPTTPTTPTTPATPATPAASTVTVGTTVTDSTGAVYEVTSTTEKTIAYKQAVKTAKKVTVPATLQINGETYKVTSIAAKAFKGCKKLTKVTIKGNVTKIGKAAFKGCTKLKKVVIKSKNIKKIGKKAFTNIAKNSVIKVPKSKKAAYKKLLRKSGYKKTVK